MSIVTCSDDDGHFAWYIQFRFFFTVKQRIAILAMIDFISQHPFILEWTRPVSNLFYNLFTCQMQGDAKTLTTVMFFDFRRHIFYVAKEGKLPVANKNSNGCFPQI